MRHLRSIIALLLLVAALLSAGRPAGAGPAGAPGCRVFAQTWAPLCGTFLAYWQAHGGLAQQGYPLGGEFVEISSLDGRPYLVQYFERAVFEHHPENAPPYDVLLGQLGAIHYRARYPGGAPGQRANVSAGARLFPDTGQHVGGGFLAYWEVHGGLAQQGNPLTEEFTERSETNGQLYTVQYFERAVLEWHPEHVGSPDAVQAALLGRFQAQAVHPRGFLQRGMNVAAWYSGTYRTPAADAALARLATTGANALALVVTGYQDRSDSLTIDRSGLRTPTDADLQHIIALAHRLGMTVLLKPHVDLADGTWRGVIGGGFAGDDPWHAWFTAYRAFLDHYADLARQTGVDGLCIGTELKGTSARAADWRAVAADARAHYGGPLSYASNWDETGITWWDAVDAIGVDAYYPLTDHADPTLAELARAWTDRGYVAALAGLAQQFGRPVILTEIGYRSIAGANQAPVASPPAPRIDPSEQAQAYHAAFTALLPQPWLAGIYWWNWELDPAAGGPQDGGFTPQGKPAEAVLRACYGGGC